MSRLEELSINDRNTDIPFFPNITWNLTNEDFDITGLPTFNWIQAFFAPTLGTAPYLAVFTGEYNSAGAPILSMVRFSFSGQRINIKGCGIFSLGVNIRGQAVSSTPIGDVEATDLLEVIAYGGMK